MKHAAKSKTTDVILICIPVITSLQFVSEMPEKLKANQCSLLTLHFKILFVIFMSVCVIDSSYM